MFLGGDNMLNIIIFMLSLITGLASIVVALAVWLAFMCCKTTRLEIKNIEPKEQ